jgi:hypothetical protein
MAAQPISTTAPMPTWHGLLSRRDSPEDAALAAPWIGNGGGVGVFLARASWALRAIVDAHTEALGIAPRLWVPDYFCNSALAAVRLTSCRISFYPVTANFTPDWSACQLLAEESPPQLFLQVHYFGWPADLSTARDFCRMHGAALIEDAAHALGPWGDIGPGGDYTIWSLYKHLPAPDGGLLVVHPSSPIAAAAVSVARRLAACGAAGTSSWTFRKALQLLVPRAAASYRRAPPAFDNDPPSSFLERSPGGSRRARHMVAAASKQLSAIAERRRVNEEAARHALRHCAGLRPAFPSSPGVPPYRAVFRAERPLDARYWYERLVTGGNAAETWPDLAPEVREDPQLHRTALHLRATCFALPIHADRSPEQIIAAYETACREPAV